MTRIIAFAGRKQSGKSTACEYIAKILSNAQNPLTYKIYSFADPLKQNICIDILGLSYDQCYGSDDNKNEITHIKWNNNYLTAREVMQVVGTEIFRKMYPEVWTTSLINQIKKDDYDIALISDCRFPNEVEIIQKNYGYVLRLTRNPFNSDHDSEKALDSEHYDWQNFDFVLDNQNMDLETKNKEISQYLWYSRALYHSNMKYI